MAFDTRRPVLRHGTVFRSLHRHGLNADAPDAHGQIRATLLLLSRNEVGRVRELARLMRTDAGAKTLASVKENLVTRYSGIDVIRCLAREHRALPLYPRVNAMRYARCA